jgi:prephenate dehydrogenase
MRWMHFQKITLVGVGLLGGSLGLASQRHRLAREVVGLVRRPASIAECEQLGVVTEATQDPRAAAADADLVVLCTPISQMKATLEPMLPALKRGAVVTDVGSVKGSVVQELEPLVAAAGGHFVGSHPMAGAEKTGPAAAKVDLFAQAICVVTPTPRSSPTAVERVEEFWTHVGGRSLRLSPDAHDELVSRSSHLPHVVAAGLANYVLSPLHPEQQGLLCANGFRDTTRIASSSAEMWRDIALANRKNLGRVLGIFIDDLEEFRHALEAGEGRVIEDYFEKARQRRDAWCNPTPSPSPE